MNNLDKQRLIEKFNNGSISHQDLGKLRRSAMTELLDNLLTLDADEVKKVWLDKKASKLSTSMLAKAIGYNTKTHNVRQSYKQLVSHCEEKLKERGIITTNKRTNAEVSEDNTRDFLAFLDERLNNSEYHWPKNDKGGVYRRVLWAMYLETEPDDIQQAPSFFSRDIDVANKLKEIDLLLVEDKVKWLDYKSASALDAMSDTMLSKALSNMRAELKKAREELVLLREQNAVYEKQLQFYQAKDDALSHSGIDAFKAGSAH